MSTQSSTAPSIPFSISHPQQSFRLLELPSDLVDLISLSSDARLRLTSTPGWDATADGGTPRKGKENLHLCTDDKVWAIRQVSTSNSVFVTETREVGYVYHDVSGREEGDGDTNMDGGVLDAALDMGTDTTGLAAVGQVGSVLELVPLSLSRGDVERSVRELVPVYDESLKQMLARESEGGSRKRESVRNDIPAPDSLIEEAMDRLCVFEHHGQCQIPNDQTLLDVWRRIVEGCAIQGIRLDQPFHVRKVVETLHFGKDEDEDMYSASTAKDNTNGTTTAGDGNEEDVTRTIAHTLLTRTFPRLGLILHETASATSSNPTLNTITLNPQTTTTFLGRLLLTTQPASTPTALPTFQREWRHLLPEKWWDLASVSALEGSCTISTNSVGEEVIRWNNVSPLGNAGVSSSPSASDSKKAVGTETIAGKRKWHEKFAAQRNIKR